MLKNAKLKSLDKGNGLFACKNCKIWHLKLLICPWGRDRAGIFVHKYPWGQGLLQKSRYIVQSPKNKEKFSKKML